jgi:hypothetical protein
MSDRSGDLCGIGLVVYELAGKLSRAFSSSAFAAFAIAVEVPGRVVMLGEPGFSGSGGGARSGSELSHLANHVSGIVRDGVDAAKRSKENVHWDYYRPPINRERM